MNQPNASWPRAAAALALAIPLMAFAQTKSTSDGIAEYRKMLEDGNPAELYEAKGESLWKQARGPKKATLEKCDLGLGPGVVTVPGFSFRAISPTPARCRMWSRAWSLAWPPCRASTPMNW